MHSIYKDNFITTHAWNLMENLEQFKSRAELEACREMYRLKANVYLGFPLTNEHGKSLPW